MPSEFQRLLRELDAAKTPQEAHAVVKMSMISNLTPQERRQIQTSFPRKFTTNGTEKENMLAYIGVLQDLNVWSGQASEWCRTLPWRDNPWQMVQLAASRAVVAAGYAAPATFRGPLERYARALALGNSVLDAWEALCKAKDSEPMDAASQSQQLASRCLFGAWTYLQMYGKQTPAQAVEAALRRTLKVLNEPVTDRELTAWSAQLAVVCTLSPDKAPAALGKCAPKTWLVLPEVLSVAAMQHFLRHPQEAEAWLNDMLTR